MTTTVDQPTVVTFAQGVKPNPGGQADFVNDWSHRWVAYEGGQGAGKTWAGARKLLTIHIFNAFYDAEGVHLDLLKEPGKYSQELVEAHEKHDGKPTYVQSAIIAPTYSQARDYDIPEMKTALSEAGLDYTWRAQDFEFHIHNFGTKDMPSRIIVRTADKPETITGWNAAGIWGDEAPRWKSSPDDPTRDPMTQLSGRLRHPVARFKQGLFTHTNEGVTTTVYQRFHYPDPMTGEMRPDHAFYVGSSRENPRVADFVAAQEKLLSPELARQYIDGEAVDFRGSAVYPVFGRSRHVLEDLEFNPSIPIGLALDFNISPGMHGELCQYDEARDEFVVIHELHGPRMDVRGLVAMLRNIISEHSLAIGNGKTLDVFGDATGTSQTASTGESCYGVLAEALDAAGINFRARVPNHNPPVIDRVNAVNSALLDMTGKVHVRIHPRCVKLLEDLQRMRRNSKGEIDKLDKILSHASDAFGYAVHYQRPAVVKTHYTPARIGLGR